MGAFRAYYGDLSRRGGGDMKVGLVVHRGRPEAAAVAERLRAGAASRNVELVDGISAGLDLIIAIGGDGTMLSALAAAIDEGIGVVGINVGVVGYLADVEPDQVEQALDRLVAGEYTVEERLTVAASWEGSAATAVNDVVLEKIESQHSVRLEFDLDGERLVTYRADGVIVATPTGSTAYAFSAGGPLVPSGVEALVVAPVAAHNLFSRPLVVSADSTLRFVVRGHRPVRVNVDGREEVVLESGAWMEIGRGARTAQLVRVFGHGFAATIRSKFGFEK